MKRAQEVRLGDVAEIVRQGIDPRKLDAPVRYVGLENIKKGGYLTGVRAVDSGDLASTKYKFGSADVLFGKLRPYLAKVAQPDFEGICSTDILPIRVGPLLDRGYLTYFLLSPEIVFLAGQRSTGANLPRLKPRELLDFKLPLPDLEEQQRIARILDKAAALRSNRREAIAQMNAVERSLFVSVFGDPVCNTKSWQKELLSALGSLDRGISKHRPRNAPELLGGPYPLVQTGDVANCDGYLTQFSSTYSEIGLQQSKLWPAGTLCITIAANIAHAGVLTFDACFPDSVVGFTSDPATTAYVRVWLSFLQRELEETASQSAQKNINLAVLRNLLVPVPPMDERVRFAAQLDQLQDLKRSCREQLLLTEELVASLQSRAFKGEL
jgi:type I restriction enzyme, S subunit